MHTLPDNYKKNVEILRENLRRGLEPGQAVTVVHKMRDQFVSAGLYNDTEKQFINEMLQEIEAYTHIAVVEA